MPTYTIFTNSDEKSVAEGYVSNVSISDSFAGSRTAAAGSTKTNFGLSTGTTDTPVGITFADVKGGAPFTCNFFELFLKYNVATANAAGETPTGITFNFWVVSFTSSPSHNARAWYLPWSTQTFPFYATPSAVGAVSLASPITNPWTGSGAYQSFSGQNVTSGNVFNGPSGNTMEIVMTDARLQLGTMPSPAASCFANIRTSFASGTTQDPFITLVTTAAASGSKTGWGVLL